jgi:hypothetical protein
VIGNLESPDFPADLSYFLGLISGIAKGNIRGVLIYVSPAMQHISIIINNKVRQDYLQKGVRRRG